MAKSGPKRTPTAILKLRGSWLAKTRKDWPVDGERPEFVDFLNENQRPIWDDIVNKLEKMGILSSIDGMGIALYCDMRSQYVEARNACKGLLLKTKDGNIIQHPALSIKNSSWKMLKSICAEFGMTPSSRTGLASMEKPKSKNEKSRFFKKGS